MDSLKDYVLKIPENRIALISEKETVRYSDLINIIENNKQESKKLTASNVAIINSNRISFAKILFVLDGIVKRVLLLPDELNDVQKKEFLQKAQIEYLVYLEDNKLIYENNDLSIQENSDSNNFHTEWIIPTSGTTKTPKLISHTLDSLTHSLKKDLEKGKDYTWGLLYDMYRFAGIQVYLQSIISGSKLIVPDKNISLKNTVNLFIKKGCNSLSATPSYWRKLLMVPEISKIQLRNITLGGEIADAGILNNLKRKFPNAKIRHIYASTEAGVGFSVTDGKPGFPLDFLKNGVNDTLLRIDSNDILLIKPQDTSQRYIGSEDFYDSDGFINTGDKVKVKGDRVYFLGRDSGAINVGGNKVQPEEIESTLLELDLISHAYVYSKKNPFTGNIVCVDIVPKDEKFDSQELKSMIFSYCRNKLENYKVPAIINFVDEIKISDSGKLSRSV